MSLRERSRLIEPKPEPQTTPSLAQLIERSNAKACVSEYYTTPALRDHLKRVFECVVHRKGQGFWVQAEYGAGKTHFLGVLINLLMWRDLDLWQQLRDQGASRCQALFLVFARRSMASGCGGASRCEALFLVFARRSMASGCGVSGREQETESVTAKPPKKPSLSPRSPLA